MLSTTKIPEKWTVWSCCGTTPKARRSNLQLGGVPRDSKLFPKKNYENIVIRVIHA
jgi:hypothetical protein